MGEHFDATKTLMVGDRLDTDMHFGNRNGMDTLLVLTGVTRFEDLDKLEMELEVARKGRATSPKEEFMPKFWANSVADLLLPEGAALN